MKMSGQLPGITKSQMAYADKSCFSHYAFRSGKEIGWCTHCGEDLYVASGSTTDGSIMRCPHCGVKCEVRSCKKRTYNEALYMSVLTTYHDYQVCRHYLAKMKCRRGCKPVYGFLEVVQNWIASNGRETIMARSTIPFGMYNDYWCADSELSIKDRRQTYTGKSKYDVDGVYLYPRISLLPKVKRNGFNAKRLEDCLPMNRLIRMLLVDREAEMLAKQGQYALLFHKWRAGIGEFGLPDHAIKIATRHGCIVKDPGMWLDYIALLDHFGYDTHSPKYVCATEYKRFHDKLAAKKQIEEDKADAEKWEREYKEQKKPYIGICFGDENIVISVIGSVEEMAEEGLAMHHCVFGMGYYKKTDSLILSAKDKYGNRIETIEVSLKTLEVVQSRGVCNRNTDMHDEILSLVKKNMKLIADAKSKAA